MPEAPASSVADRGPLARTYLYAPADNARVLAKVLTRGADAIVLDLEDGVAASAKDAARDGLRSFLAGMTDEAHRPRLLVRVNADANGYAAADLDVAVHSAVAELSLPKAESVTHVMAVAARLNRLEAERGLAPGAIGLHLIIESAVGVAAVEALARCPRVRRFGLGAADLAVDLGLDVDADHPAFDHVRGRLVVASRAAGLEPPVDAVTLAVEDADALTAAARRARSFGFFGKSVIHPAQVEVVHGAFVPTDAEVERSRRILAAADASTGGAIVVDGALVDAPVVARARAVLAAGQTPDSDTSDTTDDRDA